jgi:hypothetical protein
MREIKITEMLARAAATDAGNRSMKAAGRTQWNLTDYRAASSEYNRLWLRHSNEPMLPKPTQAARIGQKG